MDATTLTTMFPVQKRGSCISNAIVPPAKSGIEGAVNTYSQNTKTILVEKQDSLGETYETFNFAVVILDQYTGTPTYIASYTYEDIDVSRVVAFNQDIRKAGQFMCVVDQWLIQFHS